MTTADIQFLNPDGLHRNPAFSQAVSVEGRTRTVYVGGQNGVDAEGRIVGEGDIGAQSRRAYANIEIALAAAGATFDDIVKWTVLAVDGQPLEPGFVAFQEVWGDRTQTPAITFAKVAALARPDALIEIEAIAVVALDPPDAR